MSESWDGKTVDIMFSGVLQAGAPPHLSDLWMFNRVYAAYLLWVYLELKALGGLQRCTTHILNSN